MFPIRTIFIPTLFFCEGGAVLLERGCVMVGYFRRNEDSRRPALQPNRL